METIEIQTQPTSEKNVALLRARIGNFDLIGINRGINLWVEMYNPSGLLFDSAFVQIDGTDWTDWPAGLTDEEDYIYVSSIILRKLNLTRKIVSE